MTGGNSVKLSVLFDNDMKSGKVCSIVCQSSCHLGNFLKHIFDIGVNRKYDFRRDFESFDGT